MLLIKLLTGIFLVSGAILPEKSSGIINCSGKGCESNILQRRGRVVYRKAIWHVTTTPRQIVRHTVSRKAPLTTGSRYYIRYTTVPSTQNAGHYQLRKFYSPPKRYYKTIQNQRVSPVDYQSKLRSKRSVNYYPGQSEFKSKNSAPYVKYYSGQSQFSKDCLDATNEYRNSFKPPLPPLRPLYTLDYNARRYSTVLIGKLKLSHHYDGYWVNRCKVNGLSGSFCAENINSMPGNGRQLVIDWIKSDLHRGNIVDSRARYMGCEQEGNRSTQIFAA